MSTELYPSAFYDVGDLIYKQVIITICTHIDFMLKTLCGLMV